MDRVYQFSVCALIVMGLILFSIIYRRMYHGRNNRVFFSLAILVFLDTIFEIMSNAPLKIVGPLADSVIFRYIGLYGYYLVHNAVVPGFFILVLTLTSDRRSIASRLLWHLSIVTPMALAYILTMVNTFTHIVFYYDDNLTYHRGSLHVFFYLYAAYYALLALSAIFKNIEYLGMVKFISMISIYFILFVGVLIQLFYPKNTVEMFTMALSILFVSVTILRPEEQLDPYLGANNYSSFIDDIIKIYRMQYDGRAILVKVVRDSSISKLIGVAGYRRLIHDLAVDMRSIAKKRDNERFSSVTYYLNNGTFLILFEGKISDSHIKSKAEEILEVSQGVFKKNNVMVDLDMAMCLLDVGGKNSDIKDYKSFVKFAHNFYRAIPDNQVVIYKEIASDRNFNILVNIDEIIAGAIEKNNLEMYFQPIYSIKDKKFTIAEALIRLKDDKYGFVSPGIFIPAAEESRMINKIGDFVIENVFRFVSENKLRDLGVDFVEVNLSTIQCMQSDIVEKILKSYDNFNIEKSMVNFEITETGAEFPHDSMYKVLTGLNSQGVEFALDDYGIGYSNLYRIMAFPFKLIKIDKSLVDSMGDEKMKDIISGIIRTLKGVKAQIVVEGIEEKEQVDWFVENKCDYIQGYYYARPMNQKDYLKFLKDNNM